ncbi:GIY-YIG nuclease family protein [Yersinia aleksiciae]|uniref:GIY-YIG nuclease family protein n=1 Tax=Yersinia aleksiciae TaxID=263819 RepID=UPI00119C9BF0|nr:GIY-YIG nuclease family protein [Yersinia aleksiciae]
MTELNDILQLTNHQSMDMPKDFNPGGWVYVLANESMPGVYKVGMTTATPEKRAKEISSSTGVPTPFIVISEYRTTSPHEHERDIHRLLSRYRVNQGREFFKTDLPTIEDACQNIIPFGAVSRVEDLTEYFNLIVLEQSDSRDPWDYIETLGVSAYGNKKEALNLLAYIGSLVIKKVTENGGAVVIHDNGMRLLGANEVPQ